MAARSGSTLLMFFLVAELAAAGSVWASRSEVREDQRPPAVAASRGERLRAVKVSIDQRAPIIADSITMTQIGDPIAEFLPSTRSATFSPDGSRFAIVTRRGDLDSNGNVYELLLFKIRPGGVSPPVSLLRIVTHSNDPAIHDVRWTADGKALLFLGQLGSEPQQVYSLDIESREPWAVSHHPTDVLAFDVAADRSTVAYIARAPQRPLLDAESRSRGLVISRQYLPDLLAERSSANRLIQSPEVFVQRAGDAQPRRLTLPSGIRPESALSLSPDRRHLLVAAAVEENAMPSDWSYAQSFFGWIFVPTYVAVDVDSGEAHLLLDAPGGEEGAVPIAWLPSSRSVIVNTFLPLAGSDPAELRARRQAPYSAEVDVSSGAVTPIVRGYCRLLSFDPGSATATFGLRQDLAESIPMAPGTECTVKSAVFRKRGTRWERVSSAHRTPGGRAFDVVVAQDMNSPPVLAAVESRTGRRHVLWDPNPQFHKLRFARVEEIAFTGSDGTPCKGGLYLPPARAPQERVPLVIQTHGWNPQRFEIDGESTAGYAAQALAGAGIAVVQLPEAPELTTPREGPQNMAEYAGVVRYLEARGLVDPARVGLQAWSRTGYSVRYSLAFSGLRFAAALIVDGLEAGYIQDLLSSNDWDADVTSEALNGGKPFGAGLGNWLEHAPTFNLDRVHTPVLQYMLGYYSFANMWETFAGLRQLRKPVDMIWLPDSAHWPIRPLERVAVQQGAVDWFRFWLQGYVDPAPEKQAQYERWRALREMQQAASEPTRQ